jgi:8-oxo-dGTP pyrophosphatase MutT (NUDIX family)
VGRRERAKRETSAGGVVYRLTSDGPKFLLIKDPYSKWGFPKGHLTRDERPEDAARREIGEETGLHGLLLRKELGIIDWYFRFRGGLIHKSCHFFLFESRDGVPEPETEEGISLCCWYSFEEATDTISYDNAREMLRAAGAAVRDLGTEATSED